MLILIGGTGSGKSVTQNLLVKKYNYKPVVSYTTRQPREKEMHGVDYFFTTVEDFLAKKESGFFLETGCYNGWHYGTPKTALTNAHVAVMTPHGFRQIVNNPAIDKKKIVSIYIDVDRRDRLIKILERKDNIEESKRRDGSDVGQFDGIADEVDLVINNDGYVNSPEELARKVSHAYKQILERKSRITTILCDIDSVVNNLVEGYLESYNAKYGDNLKFGDITEYSLNAFVKEEARDKFEEICDDALLFSLGVQPGAAEAIGRLMKHYDFYFLTSKRPKSIAVTDRWLQKFFPNYVNSQLIVCQNKSMVSGDILIDDCLDNFVLDNNKVSNTRYNIIFNKPWNDKFVAENERNFRVSSWKEIEELISELQKIHW